MKKLSLFIQKSFIVLLIALPLLSMAQFTPNGTEGPVEPIPEPNEEGASCETAHYVESEEETEITVFEGQSKVYIDFIAIDPTMDIFIFKGDEPPYCEFTQVDIYEKMDCDNLQLIHSQGAPIHGSLSHLRLNALNVSSNYIFVGYHNEAQVSRKFKININKSIITPCIEPELPCGEQIKNSGFSYSSVERPSTVDPFTLNQVCDWKRVGGTPWLIYREPNGGPFINNPYTVLGALYRVTNGEFFESISSKVELKDKMYFLNFKMWPYQTIPDSFKVWLVRQSDLDTLTNPTVNLPKLAFKQEVISFDSSSISWNETTYSKCFTANPIFDRIVFFPFSVNLIKPHQLPYRGVALDDISLIEVSAGEYNQDSSICIGEADQFGPIQIGPDCPIPGASYSWSPTSGLSNPTIANPIATPEEMTTYTMTVSLPGVTCNATDQVTIASQGDVQEIDLILPDNTNVSQLRTIAGLPGSQSSLSDKTLKVEGTLIIDEGFTFNDCNFYMAEDAKIITQNNASLRFDNQDTMTVEFFKPCSPDIYWDGIYQSGGSSFYFGRNGAFQHYDSTFWKFSNSKNGINLTDVNNVIVTEVMFRNNGRAIKVENTGTNQTRAVITDLNIRCTKPLSYDGMFFYPKRALEFINVNTDHHFLIGDLGPLHDSTSIDMYGSGGKIYIENSDDLTVNDISFYGFNNKYNYSGQPTKSNIAIQVEGHSRVPGVHITKNHFIKCSIGIRVNDQVDLSVDHNKVNKTRGGLIYNTMSSYFLICFDVRNQYDGNGFWGISYLNKIHNNQIYNVENGIHLFDSPYFHIFDNQIDMEVQSDSNSYDDNYNEESVAIYSNAYGVDILPLIPENSHILVVENNHIKHSKVGIQTEFIKSEITNNRVTDLNNRFTPPVFGSAPPAYGIRLVNHTGVIEGNKVENRLSQYSGTLPNTQEKVVGISVENAVGAFGYNYANINCNTTENTGLGLRFAGDNAHPYIFNNRMVNNEIGFALDNEAHIGDVGGFEVAIGPTEVDAANEWVGTFGNSHTYNFSNDDPNNPPKYYYKGTGPQIGNNDAAFGYKSIKDTLTSNDNIISCTAPLMVDNSSDKKEATTAYNKSGKKPRWLQKGNASDSAFYLRQQLQFYHLSKDSALYNSQQFSTFRDSMKNTALGRALGKNSQSMRSLSAQNNFDQNVSIVEPLLDKHFVDSTLSSSELDQLRQIAVLCPYTDGIAVYQARRVLHEYGERLYVNECEISQLPNNQKFIRIKAEEKQEKVPFAIYPNPADEQINISYSVEEDEEIVLKIYDVIGKQIMTKSLNSGHLHQINTSQLQHGVYIYRLFKSKEQINNGKLVIE